MPEENTPTVRDVDTEKEYIKKTGSWRAKRFKSTTTVLNDLYKGKLQKTLRPLLERNVRRLIGTIGGHLNPFLRESTDNEIGDSLINRQALQKTC